VEDFKILYKFYDLYNGADFKGFYKFFNTAIEKFGNGEPEIVLDLGCGTGELSKLLSKKYQTIGVDLSSDMLSLAISKCNGKVLLLNQDMRELELYGTIQGCVSFCDCFNYMETEDDLMKAFSKVGLFMESGGLLVFDASTKYRFEKVLNGNAFVNENENGMLIHQSKYSKKDKCLNITVTIFEENGKNYKKYVENQKEYYYSEKQFIECAKYAGFELCGVFSDMKFSEPTETDIKHYYIFRRLKWEI